MINIEKICESQLQTSPFKYTEISNLFTEKGIQSLLKNLPSENNYRSIRDRGSDKTYNVVNNLLLKLGEKSPNPESKLPSAWKMLVKELQSKSYVTCLSNLLQTDLSFCHQEITLKRYGFNDFISPHTDKSHVVATHMLFLNQYWESDWGGSLCFMLDSKKIFKEYLPVSAHSVAFVRSDNSWHCVPKIMYSDAERIAIQVAFWNIQKRDVLNGRTEYAVNV